MNNSEEEVEGGFWIVFRSEGYQGYAGTGKELSMGARQTCHPRPSNIRS
jgi:hypothetical protein